MTAGECCVINVARAAKSLGPRKEDACFPGNGWEQGIPILELNKPKKEFQKNYTPIWNEETLRKSAGFIGKIMKVIKSNIVVNAASPAPEELEVDFQYTKAMNELWTDIIALEAEFDADEREYGKAYLKKYRDRLERVVEKTKEIMKKNQHEENKKRHQNI